MAILVTGGAGYIGSHTVVELLKSGESVIVVDNLCNSSIVAIYRIKQIVGVAIASKLQFINADIRDRLTLENIFQENKIDSVIHFAALKAVGESVSKPIEYYDNNVYGTLVLLQVMQKHKCRNFVFSSSATVYGTPDKCPIVETATRSALSPYGSTKIIIEDMLIALNKADKSFNAVLLRYFNPVGAHESYLIGENPKGTPNNLMPYMTGAAIGKLPPLKVFGGDYSTPDGTCIRDYIHIVDLALGHIAALKKVRQNVGVVAYNLGTGEGVSVLQLIRAFFSATGIALKYTIVDRRKGDAQECFADTKKANKELDWSATRTIQKMCHDHYLWQVKNPNGYQLS